MSESETRPRSLPSWRKLLEPLASLKLTVILLLLAMLLIFTGTWAQLGKGIWTVLHDYFRCWIAHVDYLPFPVYLPGGYVIGGLMLINLLAAHAVRFRLTWRRSGIILIHLGLIMLLVGELITDRFAVESNMEINEGESTDYSYDLREVELAVIDPSPQDRDMVVAVPESRLRDGAKISHSYLPFEIQVDRFLPNSTLYRGSPVSGKGGDMPQADQGEGAGLFAVQDPEAAGTSQDVDVPSAYVTLSRNGERLGTWLLSVYLSDPQPVEVDGSHYGIALRFRRYYKPYRLTLVDFSHDRYTGTEVAKNYSSRLRLEDPERGEDREVLIYMNHPLRYRGETLYQSAFKNNDRTTILQVVHNPGWTVPYLACAIGGLGLLIHFGLNLFRFLRRRRTA